MKHNAKKRMSLLAVFAIACSQAAAPAFAADGAGKSQPAAAVAAMPAQGESSKKVGVSVTPPKDITFGQIPGDPSAAQVDQGNGIDKNAAFTYRYVGVDGTDYDSSKKPLGAGSYRVVAALDSATHSGEDASAPFTIRKADSGAAERRITVPTTGGIRTVSINELNLYSGMLKGAKIKEAVKGSGESVLETVAVRADGVSVNLNMKPARDGESQTFTLLLESDNYKNLTVTVTVTAAAAMDDFEITNLAVNAPGAFPYGTMLADIIDLRNCTATLNGQAASGTFTLLEPRRIYSVGEDTEVALRFTSNGREYTKTLPAKFTIEPLEVTPIGYDEQFFKDGYYILIYANSPYNVSEETLKDLIPARKDSFHVTCEGEEVVLNASWTVDENNPSFEPQGQKPHYAEDIFWYDWYAYTAALTPQDAGVKGLALADIKPKAYVRVVPVTVTLTLSGSNAKSMRADDIMKLTEENWKDALKLSTRANAACKPVEEIQYIDERDVFTGDSAQYAIAGWKMDGKDLTLAALKAKAADATGRSLKVTLTPVYADVPAWADITAAPTFELTITRGRNTKS